jgi:2-(1,2-epoxy-1,2-dihydrophenyl)acetyl-CoA isomerase
MDIEGQYAGFTLAIHEPGIAWIRFEREDGALNGFTAASKRDLTDLMLELNIRGDIRVVVFSGSNNSFSAGDDFKNFYSEAHWKNARSRSLNSDRRPDELGLYNRLRLSSQKLTAAVYESDLVTIAAIDGVCIQSALSLALACDFRIASKRARLGSGTLRFGFQPDENGHYLLVRQIGPSRALEFLLDSKILAADTALAWGMVNEVVEVGEIEDHVMEMARRYANGPQVAMRMLKRAIYRAYETDFHGAGEDIALRTAISDHNADVSEGVAAWVEKRPPHFNSGQGEHSVTYKTGRGVRKRGAADDDGTAAD